MARQEGARSVFEDGLEKVKNGVTTIEELVRIAPPPDSLILEKNISSKVLKKDSKVVNKK